MNNIEKLLAALIEPVQSVEDALWQLLTARTIDTAIGEQLNVIGRVVGQPRNGLVDDDYRRYIRARIATSRSDGTANDVITVARLVLNETNARFELHNQGVAAYVLRVRLVAVDDEIADIMIAFLRQATAAGVRVILESSSAAPNTTFKWDTPGRGWDSGAPFVDARD